MTKNMTRRKEKQIISLDYSVFRCSDDIAVGVNDEYSYRGREKMIDFNSFVFCVILEKAILLFE